MTHVGPDADGLGSQLAFHASARKAGVRVTVVNEDPLPPRYGWLDPHGTAGWFERDASQLDTVDLGLMFDAHELSRIARPARHLQERGVDVWTVDHHVPGPQATVTGVVASQFTSTGELVYRLLQALGWPIDAEVALGLYAAMSFDTGSFRFLRNQGETLRVAAALLDTGLDANPIQEALFASKPRDEVVLLGRVLERLQFASGGRIAWVLCPPHLGAGLQLADDAIGETMPHLIGIEGVLAAMMLKPGRKPGEWKLSLRSKAAVKVGHVAMQRGGGGHEHAAGATLTGEPDALCRSLLDDLQATLRAQLPE